MKIKPFVSTAGDYHEFNDVVRHFRNAGIRLKYIEVGCGFSEHWNGPNGGYHAIFYQNKIDAKSLINYMKRYFNA